MKEEKKQKKIFSGLKNLFKKNKKQLSQEESLMDMSNITPGNIQVETIEQQTNEALSGIKKHEHAKENRTLYPFRYKAKSETGRKVTGIFNAESINDCIHFLQIQGYIDIKVEPKKKLDFDIVLNKKIAVGDLAFDLTQLSTYIKAGIPLVDAVKIIAQQARKVNQRQAYQRLLYNLLKGDNLSDAMDKQDNVSLIYVDN